jgi:NAD(P)-dependent dehydrogenase (short-subunit alcohol dehydrogenase family)
MSLSAENALWQLSVGRAGQRDLNLIGSFNVTRIASHCMSTNEPDANGERGVILMTASIAAFEGQIGQVAYTAAKAGIAGMTSTMARDLGSLGIRVMTIVPSLFHTGLTKGIPAQMEEASPRTPPSRSAWGGPTSTRAWRSRSSRIRC